MAPGVRPPVLLVALGCLLLTGMLVGLPLSRESASLRDWAALSIFAVLIAELFYFEGRHRVLAAWSRADRDRPAKMDDPVSPNLLFSPRDFLARLEQECRRSLRYQLHLSVLYLKCERDPEASPNHARERLRARIRNIAESTIRVEDLVGEVSAFEYAFYFPHTERLGVKIVAGRIAEALGDQAASAGIAVMPYDGRDARELILNAEREARREQSRQHLGATGPRGPEVAS